MQAHDPTRGAADAPAVEVEDGADADHDAVLEVGAQLLHEALLLRGAEGDPDDVGTVAVEFCGDGGVVKVFDGAVGQGAVEHVGGGGVPAADGVPQVAEGGFVRAEEGHAVGAAADEVSEDVGAAALLSLDAVDAFEVEGDPAAVADGEEGFVDGGAVVGVAVDLGEDVAVGDADVVGPGLRQAVVDGAADGGAIEFIADVEVGFHGGGGGGCR